MSTNEYLIAAIDLGSQAKFSYTNVSGYADGDSVYEVYDHFGVIITQTVNDVTVSLPTTGLDSTTKHYFRQITNYTDSTYPISLDLGGSTSLTLSPGETFYVFWSGSEWMSFPSSIDSSETLQGRIESPSEQSYVLLNGVRGVKYLNKVYFNISSGKGEVSVRKNGITVTSSDLVLVSGTDSTYTFAPKIELQKSDTLTLYFSELSNLEGVHYRIDIDESSL